MKFLTFSWMKNIPFKDFVSIFSPFNCQAAFQKVAFFNGVNSNFEMRLLSIDSKLIGSFSTVNPLINARDVYLNFLI